MAAEGGVTTRRPAPSPVVVRSVAGRRVGRGRGRRGSSSSSSLNKSATALDGGRQDHTPHEHACTHTKGESLVVSFFRFFFHTNRRGSSTIALSRLPLSLLRTTTTILRLEEIAQLVQGAVPMADAVLHVLVQLGVRLIEAVRLENRVPPEISGPPRRDDAPRGAPHKHTRRLWVVRATREGKDALGVGGLVVKAGCVLVGGGCGEGGAGWVRRGG